MNKNCLTCKYEPLWEKVTTLSSLKNGTFVTIPEYIGICRFFELQGIPLPVCAGMLSIKRTESNPKSCFVFGWDHLITECLGFMEKDRVTNES